MSFDRAQKISETNSALVCLCFLYCSASLIEIGYLHRSIDISLNSLSLQEVFKMKLPQREALTVEDDIHKIVALYCHRSNENWTQRRRVTKKEINRGTA